MDNLQDLMQKARQSPIQRSSILIVDDEQDVGEYLRRCLAHFGYENSRVCTNAEGALGILDEDEFALALIDLRMPGRDGLWLLRQIRKFHSDTAVIVISASRDFKDVKEALNQGAERYISKPVHMEELEHTVTSVLQKRYLTRDQASSLPNRTALTEALTAIRHEESHGFEGLGLVLIDKADELESVYGPTVADEIVKQLACRIRQVLSKNMVCRINTYQLGFLLRDSDIDTTSVRKLLQSLAGTFKKPFDFEGIPLHIDGRIGYSSISDNKVYPELHLREAEFALRRASGSNREWAIYDSSRHSAGLKRARESLELLNEFEKALQENQLSFHYQPKILLWNGALCGLEALIRWRHPVRGDIPPDKFIPRVEQSTFIHALTEYAVKKALAQMKRWQAIGIETPVSVNISAHNFSRPDFPDMIADSLKFYDIEGEMLELEITERALMSDIEQSIAVLHKLKDKGVLISIDDFGAVYSSLNYLVDVPADMIKIDQSFIQTLHTKKGSARVVEIAINLAHHLGKKVVAEGVEDTETLEFLVNAGCDIGQGYLLGRPQSPEDFLEWRKEYSANMEVFFHE